MRDELRLEVDDEVMLENSLGRIDGSPEAKRDFGRGSLEAKSGEARKLPAIPRATQNLGAGRARPLATTAPRLRQALRRFWDSLPEW